MAQAHADAGEHALQGHDAHGHGTHPPFLAHHFDTPQQQFEAGKLGMWVFLATEILMFGGLFCAYAVYRANHPEVFLYAHHYLDTFWGALNTVVLLVSSFTMAWGVRAAQLGQKTLLVALLAITIAGGGVFMVVKAIEYNAKFKHDLFPGMMNLFYEGSPDAATRRAQELPHLEHEYHLGNHAPAHGADGHAAAPAAHGDTSTADTAHDGPDLNEGESVQQAVEHTAPAGANDHHAAANETEHAAAASAPRAPRWPENVPFDHSLIAPATNGPTGLRSAAVEEGAAPAAAAAHGSYSYSDLSPVNQERVGVFFSIYFLMTGLHGLHVLIGMGLIGWILVRSVRGDFGPEYFMPVDLVGLYWHLVDLIWIFLFPLLYLIHGQVGS